MASDSETSLGLRDDISQILRVSDQPLEQLEATAQALLSHSDAVPRAQKCAICTCAGAIFSEAAKQHFSVLWQSIGLSRSASPDDTAAMVSSLISLCHAMPAVLDMLVPDAAHPGWHTALALSPLPPQPDFKQAQQIRVQLALLQATNSLGGAAQVWLLNAMQLGLARSRPAVLADIWQAVLQTVQESTLVQNGDESSVSHFSRSAFEYLASWRSSDCEGCDYIWDGCLAATVDSLATLVETEGPHALQRSHPHIVSQLLAQPETSVLVIRSLLGRYGKAGKTGTTHMFLVYSDVFKGKLAALLTGCAELLKPESNCTLPVRMAGLAAMHKATATPREAKGDDEATESAAGQQAWPAAVMQSVLFAAGHDSAKSLRRAVLRLLASIPHEHLSEAEQPVLQLLASKCRDKDCQTRSLAFGVLAASPARALLAHLSLDQWRSIISSGVLLNQGQTAAKAEQSQVSHELMRHTADLLRIYIQQSGLVNMADPATMTA
eukprot:jgi/Astpho2/5646/Aster-x1305